MKIESRPDEGIFEFDLIPKPVEERQKQLSFEYYQCEESGDATELTPIQDAATARRRTDDTGDRSLMNVRHSFGMYK